jgi:hypothetical protein
VLHQDPEHSTAVLPKAQTPGEQANLSGVETQPRNSRNADGRGSPRLRVCRGDEAGRYYSGGNECDDASDFPHFSPLVKKGRAADAAANKNEIASRRVDLQ